MDPEPLDLTAQALAVLTRERIVAQERSAEISAVVARLEKLLGELREDRHSISLRGGSWP